MLGAIIGGAASLAGGIFGANSAAKSASKDRKLQKEFAQKSIGWRADDAEAAGFHRLVGATGQSTAYTPVGDGGAGAILSNAASNAGQQVGGAIDAIPQKKAASAALQSSLALDAANIDLVKAQKLQIMNNIQLSRLKAVGGQQPLPQPGKKDKIATSTIPVKLEDGTIIQYPNPDLGFDLGELATYLGATYYGEARTKLNSWLHPKKKPLEVTINRSHAKGK